MVGVCVNGECFEANCATNKYNVDLAPDNGCEYSCTLSNSGVEKCDDLDNDCDIEIDEDFTLYNDPNNCSKCGKVCGPFAHTLFDICAGGECKIGQCHPDWADLDGDPYTGCEEPLVIVEIWVDPFNVGDPFQDGSEDHPYDTIPKALAAASGWELIRLKAGVYSGPITVNVEGVTIQGESKEGVMVNTVEYKGIFTITADQVTLKTMSLSEGIEAVRFSGVAGGVVENLLIAGIGNDYSEWGMGVAVENSSGIHILDTVIDNVTGYYGYLPAATEPGYGIWASGATGLTVEGCTITNISGGDGYDHKDGYSHKEHDAEVAAGIYLQSSVATVIKDSVIGGVTGGQGGIPFPYATEVGRGALGAGVWMVESTSLQLTNTVLYDISGGKNGNGSPDAYSACLHVSDNSGGAIITNVTCVGSGKSRQRGVWLKGTAFGPTSVTSSIVADMTDRCYSSPWANPATTLTVAYTNNSNCGVAIATNATIQDSCFSVTPSFFDPDNNDYHLKASSPCVDAGKPESEYCNEPEPNGCRINMGAYGNTGEAKSDPDGQHCACD